ncbi:MAG: DUF1292 domain-containing protein [Dethiobacter sp.]|nr:DUF1292 domain-containing protein [Dethiobacter sp.]MBS3983864.1 DUF1292 domain-containing protein [Dethiobacter sp.]MCL4462697.1 DUF1292 domain-containing protein [Bacillota bacterium]MCL5993796.1 DUF1292 domain-containing protein [Bacillota bacterium]
MTEINDDIVKLLDEEGQEHSFVVLNIIEVKENKYAIMIPVEDELSELDEQEAIVFRIDENDGEQMLTVVEEGEEWEAVAEAWEEMSRIDEDDEEYDEEADGEDEEYDEEEDGEDEE